MKNSMNIYLSGANIVDGGEGSLRAEALEIR